MSPDQALIQRVTGDRLSVTYSNIDLRMRVCIGVICPQSNDHYEIVRIGPYCVALRCLV